MSDPTPNPNPEPTSDPTPEPDQTFTQADVDRIVRERVKREREKYADYDDLKAKASEKATAEERIAALEQEIQRANLAALRSRVQAKYGISDEDAELFLLGTDEDTLTAQAKRLADREEQRKQKNNVSPREGNNPKPASDELGTFTKNLFSRAAAD